MSHQTKEAIAPVRDRSPLKLADRQIIASVLSWDMQGEVSPDEVETIAIAHDIVWIKLTDNRALPIHIESFRCIRRQQLEGTRGEELAARDASNTRLSPLAAHPSNDADVNFVMEMEAKLEADADRAESIEVDSTESGIYRIWKGMALIGIVRRCDYTGGWIAEPVSNYNPQCYQTADQAIKAVVRAWNRAQGFCKTSQIALAA